MADISKYENFINVSDVTERVDELREGRADHDKENGTERSTVDSRLIGESLTDDGEPVPTSWEAEETDDAEELERLEKLLDQCKGYGDGHHWEGYSFPATLIADSHFPAYAEEFANEIGAVGRENASWIVIDWEATAKGMQQDYTQVDYDGIDFWFRS